MNPKQQLGLIVIVVALFIGVWTIIRVTSLGGQMHDFQSPIDEYELHTFIGGTISFFTLILGVVMVGGDKTPVQR